MTLEVDGHSDPCSQGSPTTTVGDHCWWKHGYRAVTYFNSEAFPASPKTV